MFKNHDPISLRADSLVPRVQGKVWRQSRHRAWKILAKIFLELAQVSLLTDKRPIKKPKLLQNVHVFANIPHLIFSIIQMVPL